MTRLSDAQFAELLRRNPQIQVAETRVTARAAIPASVGGDTLTAQFDSLWLLLGGPALVREYRFCERRWRFDYAHPGTRIAIELNGGVWSGGRHVRGAGYLRDREKVNAAQLLGWRVVELGTGQVNAENLEPIINAILSEADNAGP